jgi:hypothetical protein
VPEAEAELGVGGYLMLQKGKRSLKVINVQDVSRLGILLVSLRYTRRMLIYNALFNLFLEAIELEPLAYVYIRLILCKYKFEERLKSIFCNMKLKLAD